MPLTCVLESLEGLNEDLKAFYKEVDGKFVLDLDGESIKLHPATKPLQNAFETTKTERNDLKAKLTELEAKVKELPDDFDAARWAELKIAAEKDKEKKDKDVANLQEMYDTRLKNLEQAHAAKLGEKDGQIALLDAELDDLVVSTQLTDHLVSNNVGQEYLEASKLLIKRRVKVEKADGQRKVVVETNVGDQPLKDYVRAWADSDGKPFLAKATPLDAPGSGRRFTGSDNPFLPSNWNKTAQQKLPAEKREEMARAAGFKDYQAGMMSARPLAKSA